jgi:diadenosine tetraphosphatase ApaH/serine/threonine PP2A family protein phosphatase
MSTTITVYNTPCSLGVPPADIFIACVDQDWICYAAGTEKQGPGSYEEGRMGWGAGRFGQGRAAPGQVDSYICKFLNTSAFLGERHGPRHSAEDP